MNRASTKAQRLLQIEALLLSFPDGLSQAEIARRLGVHRSTINRYLPDLTGELCIYETDDGRLAIDRDHYLMNVRLTLHESTALHLAARLMATRTDKQNPHAAAALRKLGLSLDKLAPHIAQHLKASAAVMDDQAQRHDPVYLAVLETLTRAWSDGRVARVWHRMPDGKVFDYDFSPYFIEPYAVGQTTHVIGWRQPPGALRTFKLERIQRAELTGRSYTVPADFDPSQLLSDAWGIWYTEAEPVEVLLRFHPRVAGRVRETRWHRSEQLTDEPDGRLLWRARVAEPQEMLPWIRGWGADVEVLEPAGLRRALVTEARRLAVVYDPQPVPALQLLWAKAHRSTGESHPLICHMIDVAHVARHLWDQVLTDSIREQFANALGLDTASAGRMIAFWAGLHDLGKACPAFQRQYSLAEGLLRKAGLSFPAQYGQDRFYHGTASAELLPELLEEETHLPRPLANRIACAVGGHHGAWPQPSELQALRQAQLGDDDWDAVRGELVRSLAAVIQPPALQELQGAPARQNALLTLLSGLVSVADWIGSMEHYFPFSANGIDLQTYAQETAAQADRALRELAWLGWQPPAHTSSFDQLFGFSPRPMQQTVIDLARQLDRPALVIIEAPTGVGKTEAALYLADHWAHACRQRGLYVAMPTMATSNQMFSRVGQMVGRRYPESTIRPLLIHSQVRWMDDMDLLEVTTDDSVSDMTWFLPRKRSLLAPFGVGTVDQAFLSVLQARHFFVRLFGLGHKTVVFDEVHAYDTYMSALFQRLLGWLQSIGTSVVILSATLPHETRERLLAAYAGDQAAPAPGVSYPAVTWATEGHMACLPLLAESARSLTLEWTGPKPDALAARLADELSDGGCAAAVCSTVARSQEVFQAIRAAGIVSEPDLMLFHARFPFAWRDEIERKVLARFGRDGDRPSRAILVATQVIEQSLDLDFDLMVTDMAPVDLLLQRAGRLHRHRRDGRPSGLATPRLLIASPLVGEDGTPGFGPAAHVYEPYLLLRSYLALQGRHQLSLPADTEELIESVYGQSPLPVLTAPFEAALARAAEEMRLARERETAEAARRLIPAPDNRRLMSAGPALLEEDRPALHRALQALTRLTPPSVSLVCVHRTAAGLSLELDGSGPAIDLDAVPDQDLTRQLARHTLSVSHGAVVRHFLDQSAPAGWRRHALLRDHRAAIFTDGLCPLEDVPYVLRLCRALGLQISRSTESDKEGYEEDA